MTLLQRLAYATGRAQGRRQGRYEGRAQATQHAVEFLRAQAAAHHGHVGDARRRGALNAAADYLRDGRPAGRP